MAIAIVLVIVALAAGFAGARMERRRSSSITKREATNLRRDIAEVKFMFEDHYDTHKVLKYQVEGLAHDIIVIAGAVGLNTRTPTPNA